MSRIEFSTNSDKRQIATRLFARYVIHHTNGRNGAQTDGLAPMTHDLDALLPRKETADELTKAGYLIRPATLATKATRGGGPPYQIFNGRVIYKWGDALSWARAQTVSPRTRGVDAAA
jgi:hypothetical protein